MTASPKMDDDWLLPCPFCGHQSDALEISEGSTFRWRVGSCKACGASTGEERIQTHGEGTNIEWEQTCEERIRKSWNTRALESRSEVLEEGGGDWQCRDFGDGWITFPDRKDAMKYQKDTGAMVRHVKYFSAPRAEPGAPEQAAQEARWHSIEPASAAPEVDVKGMVERLRGRGRELAGSTLITGQDDAHTMFSAAALLESAHARGRAEGLEEAAKVCEQLWKNSPNDRASGFHQSLVSHGCVACVNSIRSKIKPARES